MNREGRIEHPPIDALCILCGFTFESHQWLTPSGFFGTGTKTEGHDWTPRIGKPVRHPRFVQMSEWARKNAERKRA